MEEVEFDEGRLGVGYGHNGDQFLVACTGNELACAQRYSVTMSQEWRNHTYFGPTCFTEVAI